MSLGENGYVVVSDAIDLQHIERVERELREFDIMALIAETMRKPDADSIYMTVLPWTHSCTAVLKDFIKAVPHSSRAFVSSIPGLRLTFPATTSIKGEIPENEVFEPLRAAQPGAVDGRPNAARIGRNVRCDTN